MDINLLKVESDRLETELFSVMQKRIEALECDNSAKLVALENSETMLKTLKEDFKYNLKLLQDRDEDLSQYEISLTSLKSKLNSSYAEISELKVQNNELQLSLSNKNNVIGDLHQRYQRNVAEKIQEYQNTISLNEKKLQSERDVSDKEKHYLQQQLTISINELEIQKQELMRDFEEVLCKKDHEHKIALDKVSNECLEQTLKNQLLQKEISLIQQSNLKDKDVLEETRDSLKKADKELKSRDWEIEDLKSYSDYRIKELQDTINEMTEKNNDFQSGYVSKLAEAEHVKMETQKLMEVNKSDFDKREATLRDKIAEMKMQYEESIAMIQTLESEKTQLRNEKELIIEKYMTDAEQIQDEFEQQIKHLNREKIDKDIELGHLRGSVLKLNDELIMRKQDISRYKMDAKKYLEHEANLRNRIKELELQWKGKYDDIRRIEYGKNEELLQQLTDAKDSVQKELAEKDRELKLRNEVSYNFVGNSSHDKDAVSSEISSLKNENAKLKGVISHMKTQLEEMSDPNLIKQTKDLIEDTCQEINAVDETASMSHIRHLNEIIGSLRLEKMNLLSQIKKHQVRIQHLENEIKSISSQPREKEVEVQQMRFELSSQSRRSQTQISALRQRILDLELEVKESTKEAEQFHHELLVKNENITRLENDLSKYKVKKQMNAADVNFGAQEIYIKQLQDEVSNLRERRQMSDISSTSTPHDKNLVRELQAKLLAAAKQLLKLSREKQQLIDVGNRLRSELLSFRRSSHRPEDVTVPSQCGDSVSNEDSELRFSVKDPEHDHTKKMDRKSEVPTSSFEENHRAQNTKSDSLLSSLSGMEGIDELWKVVQRSYSSEFSVKSPKTELSTVGTRYNDASIPSSALELSTKLTNQNLAISGNRVDIQLQSKNKKLLPHPKLAPKKTKPKVRNYNIKNDLTNR